MWISCAHLQVDFDDGNCPTYYNQIKGISNIYKVVHNQFHGELLLPDALYMFTPFLGYCLCVLSHVLLVSVCFLLGFLPPPRNIPGKVIVIAITTLTRIKPILKMNEWKNCNKLAMSVLKCWCTSSIILLLPLHLDAPPISQAPVLMLRPRAWNMVEHNMLVIMKDWLIVYLITQCLKTNGASYLSVELRLVVVL